MYHFIKGSSGWKVFIFPSKCNYIYIFETISAIFKRLMLGVFNVMFVEKKNFLEE